MLYIETVSDGRLYAVQSARTGKILLLQVIKDNGDKRTPSVPELISWTRYDVIKRKHGKHKA